MNILLVEPEFPIPPKSKNHKNFLPIGLLKLHDYYKSIGYKTKLIRGNKDKREVGSRFKPQKVMITSLFTYWSEYVKESVQHYKKLYPDAKVIVGGIYASLMPEYCKEYTGCDEVYIGLHKEAEKYAEENHLSYGMLDNPHPIDYQIVHASRGCFRHCDFCGTWKIEPEINYKNSLKNEICSNKLVFYDNNLLMNQSIESILNEIAEMKYGGESIVCESQSGFDGRILLNKPHLAKLLKKARFINPRIAWDNGYSGWKEIKKQIDLLKNAGYKNKDIFVFMLYNGEISFSEMEQKRLKCWGWKVQITDCRYRPLTQIYDNFNSRISQTSEDYFIHPKWSDAEVKQFRRNVRRQNICVRHSFEFHSGLLERKEVSKKLSMELRLLSKKDILKRVPDAWFPDEFVSLRKSE